MTKAYVFDVEADGLLDLATKVHCGVVANLSNDECWSYRPDNIEGFLRKLEEADVLIGHNIIGYDLPLLEKLHGFKFKGKVVDTLVMSRLHNPKRTAPPHAKVRNAAPHGLYAWGVRVGIDKPDYNEWDEFDEDMLHRCEEDVKINKEVFYALMREVKGQNWRNAHLLSFELFKNLHKQEQYGWLVDQDYMHKCISLLTHWMDRIDRTISPLLPLKVIVEETKVKGEYKYVSKPFKKNREYTSQVLKWMDSVGLDHRSRDVVGPFSRISYRIVDLNSNDETKQYLLSEGWVPDAWNYKKDARGRPLKDTGGNLTRTSPKLSGDDPFVGITGGVGRLIAKRVQARHRRSQIEGWLRNVREDGRLPAGVSGVATTGRMKHKVLVNVPGEGSFFGMQMRRCFVCKPGYKIVGTDAASCQDRCLAARANSPEFTRILLEGDKDAGTDGHSLARDAINIVLKRNGIKPITRKIAKNFSYGWKFGASDKKLGSMVASNPDVGAEIRAALLDTFPAQADLIDQLTAEWKSHAKKRINDWGKLEHYKGWVTGLDGRPIFIDSEHQILVYTLQSDEAILMSAAYNMFVKRCDKRGWEYGDDYGVVAWMHDELQIECKEDIAEEVADLSRRCIVDASRFYKMNVLQAGESDIGDNWSQTH